MSWDQLRALIEEAREDAAEEKVKPPLACPLCGTPLDYNPGRSLYNCPMGHYRVSGRPPEG